MYYIYIHIHMYTINTTPKPVRHKYNEHTFASNWRHSPLSFTISKQSRLIAAHIDVLTPLDWSNPSVDLDAYIYADLEGLKNAKIEYRNLKVEDHTSSFEWRDFDP